MSEEKPRSSPMKKVILCLMLLAVLVAAVLFLLPAKDCPVCSGSGAGTIVKTIPKSCPFCNGSGKIPILKDLKGGLPKPN